MSATDDLVPMLKKLRLSGVLQSLELRTKQAIDDNLALSEFLYRLLADEVERREAKQLMQRIRPEPAPGAVQRRPPRTWRAPRP